MIIAPFQYFISKNITTNTVLKNSICFSHKGFQIFIHQTNRQHCIINEKCLFFGECFDFENPTFSNQEIVQSLSDFSLEEKIKKINKLTGFFIFILFEKEKTRIITDAAGQLETYIYHKDNAFAMASQPHLMMPFLPKEEWKHASTPSYIVENKINIFHQTPFKNIEKLLPNFCYHLEEKKQHRFFPLSKLPLKTIDEISDEAQFILKNTIKSIAHRGKSAIALTAGWDSRMLFSSALSQNNVDYYVLNHQTKDAKTDVQIAEKLANIFGKKLQIINYHLSDLSLDEQEEKMVWKANKRTAKIAHLMNEYFPNTYLINGNISEVARNFYDPLPTRLSNKDIAYILGLKEGKYEAKSIEKWRATLQHLPLLDAIYWEHKMPNWAGSAKSISNLHNVVVSPFNNRYLLALLLSSKRKDRDKYFHRIYHRILEKIDPQLVEIPFNPTSKQQKIKLMKKIGVYRGYRYLFFKLRKLKF